MTCDRVSAIAIRVEKTSRTHPFDNAITVLAFDLEHLPARRAPFA